MSKFMQEFGQRRFSISGYLTKLTKGNGNGGAATNKTGRARAWQ
jgi:hypothetical protein